MLHSQRDEPNAGPGISHVISTFCGTVVPQNVEITWEIGGPIIEGIVIFSPYLLHSIILIAAKSGINMENSRLPNEIFYIIVVYIAVIGAQYMEITWKIPPPKMLLMLLIYTQFFKLCA